MDKGDRKKLLLRGLVVGPVETNCYFLSREGNKQVVVVDPGECADEILELLGKENEQIAAILLTHGHFDHIGAVEKLRERTGAKVYAPAAEKDLLNSAVLNLSAGHFCPEELDADVYVQDGDELFLADMTFMVLDTPGHTAGSACYHMQQDRILFAGDTLFAGSVGRTDLPTGDAAVQEKTIREKIVTLPDDTAVLPGHGQSTTIGREKQVNPYLRY